MPEARGLFEVARELMCARHLERVPWEPKVP